MHYHVLNSSIVLNYLGKTKVIASDDSRYEDVLTCIREGRLDDIPAIAETELQFEKVGLEVRDGVVYSGDEPMPTALQDRISQYKEKGIPYDSLLKFWENLRANPSFNSRKMLFDFLSHNGHPLTEDGCFVAYRGVREDLKDKHTGTFDNSPGQKLSMPRESVDDNPNNTCSHGFHVACFDYAKDFASGGKLVEVKVNPADVVAVPTDYNGTKMRVCGFEVLALCENIRTEALYGHEEASAEELPDLDEDDEEGFCGGCGVEVDEFHNFCPECGFHLGEE